MLDFNKFYSDNYNRMVNYTIKYVSRVEIAEEIVQDTFIELLNNHSRYTQIKPFTYFFMALKANIKNFYDKRANSEVLKDFSDDYISNNMFDPTENIEREFFNTSILLDSIDALPDREREVIQKIYYENYTQEEIGKMSNQGQPNVCYIQERALKRLKIHLKKRGIQ